jgi:opacity protein-like surface antigen
MAGAGWTTVDSNISDGDGYCYPDYYWGWVCHSSSYSESNLSYNLGIGLKADISKTMFTRGSYGRQWIDFSDANSDPEFDVFRLELGFKYY